MVNSIKNIVNIVLKDSEYLLIDVEIRGEKKNKILEIFVDSREILDLEKLRELNKLIWDKIVENELHENFSKITVSSPGVDRSFKYVEQLLKHIGRDIDIKLMDGTKISGALMNVDVETNRLEVSVKGKKKDGIENYIKQLDFKSIKESKIKLKI